MQLTGRLAGLEQLGTIEEYVNCVVRLVVPNLPAAPDPSDPRVFISYRRDDTRFAPGRLHLIIAAAFGDDNVFFDTRDVGSHVIRDRIAEWVLSADVILVLIGPSWSVERLHASDDYVRFEIETAIDHDIPILPVRMLDARLPRSEELPDAVRPLLDRNAPVLRDDPDFDADAESIVRAVREVVGHPPRVTCPSCLALCDARPDRP